MYHVFDIRSGNRSFKWGVDALDEADARLTLWTRMSGLHMEIHEVKLVRIMRDVTDVKEVA